MKELQRKEKDISGMSFRANMISSGRLSFAFSFCTLAIAFAYRFQLTAGLFKNSIKPFDFHPTSQPAEFILSFFPYDLMLFLLCLILSWSISFLFLKILKGKVPLVLKISGFILFHASLIALLVIHSAHLRLLFDAQTGLDTFIVREAFLNVPFSELLKFIDLRDGLFLLIPFILFWGVFLTPLFFWIWMVRIFAGFILLLISISVFLMGGKTPPAPAEIRLNPALFLLSDFVENRILKSSPGDRKTELTRVGEPGIQPPGDDFKNPIKPIKLLPPRRDHPWNIVLFMMESVGTRYIFDTGNGNPMPMPFLHQIVKEGWYLKRHFTPSNISTKAAFSLLSGLYDFFHQETFGVRQDAQLPSLQNFLGEGYDAFLVTPSPIQWYFPIAFVRNSGLREMHHYENLNFKVKEELHSLGRYIGRDEIQTIDFFIQRIRRAKEPFLGIYFSFTAHLPYFDYGPDFRIRELDGHMISRYYNNLSLLDHMIKRIYDHLRQQGILERTIIVIVGDHGQAFGQHHPDNFMHHRYSYNENLETPAVLYQPALFKPREVEFPTSHVDILPTLLDAMRFPYDPLHLDGESLFQNRLKRKYLFFYGHEGSVSSLDNHSIKVQYSLKKKRCWAFDLKADPEEKIPLDCSLYRSQLDALLEFVSYHDSSLLRYNESMKEKKRVRGDDGPRFARGVSKLHSVIFNEKRGAVERDGN